MSNIDIVIHNEEMLSVKTDSISNFLYNNLLWLSKNYSYIYLWVSYREYNIEYNVNTILLKKIYTEERFIYEVKLKGDYIGVITDIAAAFTEFQCWQLILTNNIIEDFRLYENSFNFTETDTLLYKSIESDVVFFKNYNIQDIRNKLL